MGHLDELAQRAEARGRTAEQLGVETSQQNRLNTPPITEPGAPSPEAPAQTAPPVPAGPEGAPEQAAAGPPGSALGELPGELKNALGRMLGGEGVGMVSERLRQLGKPTGDTNQRFFNLFGHMPTARELGGFSIRLDLERRLKRPPTLSEVKQALRKSDFIDRNPEPFG